MRMRIHEGRDTISSTPGLVSRDDEYRALMTRYQAGDIRAFEGLYESLAPVLAAYLDTLSPRLGQNAVLLDDVFLAIHRARRSYDPRRPFGPWATAIARHVALSRHPASGRGGRAFRTLNES